MKINNFILTNLQKNLYLYMNKYTYNRTEI